jgi:Dipeptidyl peptidase IV (DPP IV) N-terminal region.
VVALHTYALDQQDIKHIDLDRKEEFYIARIKYAPTGVLTAQVLNRHQNVLDFYHIQPDGKAHIAFTEKDKAYVDVTDDLTFLADGRFLWTSEKDNWRHIYLYSKKGKNASN